MLVEPLAGESLADNLNPIGRIFSTASASTCVPAVLGQKVEPHWARKPVKRGRRKCQVKEAFGEFAEQPKNHSTWCWTPAASSWESALLGGRQPPRRLF